MKMPALRAASIAIIPFLDLTVVNPKAHYS
jgi:hypothetical protein